MPGYVDSQRMQAGLHQAPARNENPEPRPLPPIPVAPAHGLPPGAAQPTPPGSRLELPLGTLPATGRSREWDFVAAGFAPRPRPGLPVSVNPLPDAAPGSVPSRPLDPLAEGLPHHRTAAGGRRVDGPEDFNAYETKRVEQADKAIKLAKVAIGATVAVGVTGVVLAGLNFGSKSENPPPPPPA